MAVYFIQDDASGHVKIGHAANPAARLAELQVANPGNLHILRTVDGGQKIEAWLHRKFNQERIRGEWFLFVGEMLSVVPPDEIPTPPKPSPRFNESPAEHLRACEKLGLLTEKMKQDYAVFLRGGE